MTERYTDDRLRSLARCKIKLAFADGDIDAGILATELLAARARIAELERYNDQLGGLLDIANEERKKALAERDELAEDEKLGRDQCNEMALLLENEGQARIRAEQGRDALRAKLAALDVEPRPLKHGDEWTLKGSKDEIHPVIGHTVKCFTDAERIVRVAVPLSAPETFTAQGMALDAERDAALKVVQDEARRRNMPASDTYDPTKPTHWLGSGLQPTPPTFEQIDRDAAERQAGRLADKVKHLERKIQAQRHRICILEGRRYARQNPPRQEPESAPAEKAHTFMHGHWADGPTPREKAADALIEGLAASMQSLQRQVLEIQGRLRWGRW